MDDPDEHNNCLMQPQTAVQGKTELCSAANHDLEQGCYDNVLGGYLSSLTTRQTVQTGKSCWNLLADRFSFVTAPEGLPDRSFPGNYVSPTFIDQRDFDEAIVLVLDRSGSMAFNTDDDDGEVCANGRDDNHDGLIDEQPCTTSRISYLQAATRAFLHFASNSADGIEMGITSFASDVTVDTAIGPVGDGKELLDAVDNLEADGATAIGDALLSAGDQLHPYDSSHRSVILFTDGNSNVGSSVLVAMNALTDAGVQVHLVGTGAAVNSWLFSQDSGEQYGYPQAPHSVDALVPAFADLWARLTGRVLAIPLQRFHVNSKNDPSLPQLVQIDSEAWFTGNDELASMPNGAKVNEISFTIASGTTDFDLVLAGNVPIMDLFSVDGSLTSPSASVEPLFSQRANKVVTRDPYFEVIRVINPEPGEWKLHVWGSSSVWEEQTGYLTIMAKNPAQDFRLWVSPSVATVEDIVTVNISPSYVTMLLMPRVLGLKVTDPSGIGQSVPVLVDDRGTYRAEISGMTLRGTYKIDAIVGADSNSYNDPGESWTDGPSNSVTVPDFTLGASGTFYVVDGEVVGPH